MVPAIMAPVILAPVIQAADTMSVRTSALQTMHLFAQREGATERPSAMLAMRILKTIALFSLPRVEPGS
jgi:hypothetical protein